MTVTNAGSTACVVEGFPGVSLVTGTAGQQLGGQVPAMTSPIGDYLPHLKEGRLRLIATSGSARSRFAPDVPTYAEQGFKDLVMSEYYEFFMPGKTPPETVKRAADAIKAAVSSPDVVEAFAKLGLEATGYVGLGLARSSSVGVNDPVTAPLGDFIPGERSLIGGVLVGWLGHEASQPSTPDPASSSTSDQGSTDGPDGGLSGPASLPDSGPGADSGQPGITSGGS